MLGNHLSPHSVTKSWMMNPEKIVQIIAGTKYKIQSRGDFNGLVSFSNNSSLTSTSSVLVEPSSKVIATFFLFNDLKQGIVNIKDTRGNIKKNKSNKPIPENTSLIYQT